MKHMTPKEILEEFDAWKAKGFTTTTMLKTALLNEYNHGYKFQIESKEAFLHLVVGYLEKWDVLSQKTLVTRQGRPNMLIEVAERLKKKNWTFTDFADENVKGKYSPSWLKKCADIEADFDWEKFGVLYTIHLDKAELKACPDATLRIVDGLHRSFALANMLLQDKIEYKPITTVLLTPRLN